MSIIRIAAVVAVSASFFPIAYAADPTPPSSPPSAPEPKPGTGFRIKSDDGANELRIGGQLQVDAWVFREDAAKAYIDEVRIWDGTPDGSTVEQDGDDAFDFAGRVTFQPFVKSGLPALANLQLGVSGSVGEVKGTQTAPALATSRSSGRATWFRYVSGTDLATTAIADGSRTRIGGHLLWRFGPAHVFGEIIGSSQDVTLAERAETVTNLAWAAQASVVLSGEDASWTGLKPKRDFDPAKGCAGAFELAVRWSELAIDDAAFDAGFADTAKSARGSRALAVSLNGYLSRAVKVQLGYEQAHFDGGSGSDDRATEHLVGGRTQLLF